MKPVVEAFNEKFPGAVLAKEAGAIIAKANAARERQTSLDFGKALDRGAATYFDLGQRQPTLPGISNNMLLSGGQMMLPGFPMTLSLTTPIKP